MVAGTQPQPQQQQPLSAEEEAVKRNTDCVYFLASPLTCKKGSECEYRHSEYARVNPRDCWYWLNSACLNPKCPFRHPPIEGLLGTQATPPAVPATSSSQPASAAAPASGQSSGKPACIYFQKGYCMKGDRCQFSHGLSPTAIAKVTQPLAPSSHISDPSSVKKVFGGLQKCAQEQKLPPAAISRGPKAATAPLPPPTRNGVSVARIPVSRDQPAINGISTHRPSRSRHAGVSGDHGAQNGRDTDEFLRESSPGFDVLVEDELGDQDYYRGSEDQYGRPRGHNGRNPNADEYGVDHLPAVAVAVADGDRGRFRDPRGYESYDRVQGQQHGWEPRRASAERVAAEPAQYDRRGYRKSNSPDNNINGPDLRHRLSQHRRADGLRSVVSDDRKHRSSSRVERDSRHPVQPHEGPLSSRLRGRINFGPDRGRSQGGSPPPPPPSRPQAGVLYPGRFGDRLKGRAQEEYNGEGRSFRGSRNGDFSGPKSLSELKGRKLEGHEDREQSVLGKRKSTVAAVEASQQHGGEASFEGPMSLSEILKRKRGTAGRETESIKPAASSGSDVVRSEVEKAEDGNVNGLEVEEGMIYDDNDDDDDEVVADDDQELVADDQAPGEYDYEEEEYDIENAEGEDEYLEDEDDDFAKKIGVLSS